jgi:hypothetical protein
VRPTFARSATHARAAASRTASSES